MSETPTLPSALAAQVNEAAATTPGYRPTITFRGLEWTIPAKPGATMLYHIESDRIMHAIKSALPAGQFETLLELDLDVEELETFIEACNAVWGIDSGN